MAATMRALLALLLLATIPAALPGPALAEVPPARVVAVGTAPRILLYGDSQVMGSTGDWTWRYRLWRSLRDDGVAADFVGPRDDLFVYTTRATGSQRYRDPQFDRDHAALSGMTMIGGRYQLGDLVGTYHPDVAVGMIGINDLGRGGRTPAEVVAHWRSEIGRARALAPGVDIVIVQLPQTWFEDVVEYDAGLVALARELDTPESRVVVTARPRFAPETGTYDFVHFSAVGERAVARVVASRLASIGVGSGYRPVPDPPYDGAWAPDPRASLSGDQVTLSWPAVDYAEVEDVIVRDLTAGTTRVLWAVRGTTVSFAGTRGHRYRCFLAPVKGYLLLGTRSWVPADVTIPPLRS